MPTGLLSSLMGGLGGAAVAIGLLLFPGGSHPACFGLNRARLLCTLADSDISLGQN